MADRPLNSRPGFKVLPGGSCRDLGSQLGTRTAGELTGFVVNSLMGKDAQERLSSQRKVMHLWRKMPEIWQRHCQGITLRPRRVSRELVLYLDSSAWVYELSMRRDELINRWNEIAGANEELHIDAARFQLGARAYANGERNALMIEPTVHGPESLPLDEEERRRVEATCGCVSDNKLRECVQKAMTAVLEWKKSKRD